MDAYLLLPCWNGEILLFAVLLKVKRVSGKSAKQRVLKIQARIHNPGIRSSTVVLAAKHKIIRTNGLLTANPFFYAFYFRVYYNHIIFSECQLSKLTIAQFAVTRTSQLID